jgi:MoxR-like ATPase
MLEAMQERQVTVAGNRLPLPDPFFVMATQNPIEQDGTYALPEAQLDRFLLKVVVPLPKEEEIAGIIDLNSGGAAPEVRRILDRDGIVRLQKLVDRIRVSDEIKAYIARLYASTQPGNKYVELKGRVRAGASPRSAIALAKAAQANAFLEGRTYVIPEDVRAVAHRVLRHRILLSFESEGELNTDTLVTELLQKVPVTLKADAKGK